MSGFWIPDSERGVNSIRHVRKEDLARSRNLRLMGVFGFPSLLILLLLSLFLAYGKLLEICYPYIWLNSVDYFEILKFILKNRFFNFPEKALV